MEEHGMKWPKERIAYLIMTILSIIMLFVVLGHYYPYGGQQ